MNPHPVVLELLSHSVTASATIEIIPGYVRVEWCNSCDGKGLRPKWPTQYARYQGDIRYVRSIKRDFAPFAIVTRAAAPIYGPAKTHRKRRIQKKWLKRYGSVVVGRREMPDGEWHERPRWDGSAA